MPGVARRTRATAPGHVRGIDWSHPLAHGLVFAAPFGEWRARDAVSGRTVSVVGTGDIVTSSRGAALQSANGVGNGAEVANAPALNPAHITLALSLWLPTSGGSQQHQIGGKPYSTVSFTPPYYQYVLTYVGTGHGSVPGTIRFSAAVGGSWSYATSANNAVLQQQWMRLVGVYDGAAVALYLNGALLASSAYTGNITSYATPLRIGYAAPGQNGVSGGLYQDVRVYNRGWSADEVREDYRNQWDVYDQGARTYFIPAAAGGGTTVNIDGGSFALSAGVISVDKTVEVAGGSYSLTASAISIDKTIQVGGSSYSVTAGSLSIDKTVDLTGGTFTLTAGNYTALLASGTVINVDGGTFTLTAGSVDIDKTVSLSGGSFTLTSSAVNLDWNIPIGSGSYTTTVGGVRLDKTQDLSGGLFLITPGGVTWNQLGDEPVAVTKSNQQWKYRRLKGRRRK